MHPYLLTDEEVTELYSYIIDDYQQCQELEVEPSMQLKACKTILDRLIDHQKSLLS